MADYLASLPAVVPVKAGEERGQKGGAAREVLAGVIGDQVGDTAERARDFESLALTTLTEVESQDVADSGRNEGEKA